MSINDADCDIVKTGEIARDIPCMIPAAKPSNSADSTDHMYALPTPHVLRDVSANNVKYDKAHTDHTYTELSDIPMESYGSESDSQNDVVTTGSKFIISSSDKVEINLEYQCNTSLPEATKERTVS